MPPFGPGVTIGEGIAEAAAKINEENRAASKESEDPKTIVSPKFHVTELGQFPQADLKMKSEMPTPASPLEMLKAEFKQASERFQHCMSEARNYQAHIEAHRAQQREWEAMANERRKHMGRLQTAITALEEK